MSVFLPIVYPSAFLDICMTVNVFIPQVKVFKVFDL